jgi:hypothetical protein
LIENHTVVQPILTLSAHDQRMGLFAPTGSCA